MQKQVSKNRELILLLFNPWSGALLIRDVFDMELGQFLRFWTSLAEKLSFICVLLVPWSVGSSKVQHLNRSLLDFTSEAFPIYSANVCYTPNKWHSVLCYNKLIHGMKMRRTSRICHLFPILFFHSHFTVPSAILSWYKIQ